MRWKQQTLVLHLICHGIIIHNTYTFSLMEFNKNIDKGIKTTKLVLVGAII